MRANVHLFYSFNVSVCNLLFAKKKREDSLSLFLVRSLARSVSFFFSFLFDLLVLTSSIDVQGRGKTRPLDLGGSPSDILPDVITMTSAFSHLVSRRWGFESLFLSLPRGSLCVLEMFFHDECIYTTRYDLVVV